MIQSKSLESHAVIVARESYCHVWCGVSICLIIQLFMAMRNLHNIKFDIRFTVKMHKQRKHIQCDMPHWICKTWNVKCYKIWCVTYALIVDFYVGTNKLLFAKSWANKKEWNVVLWKTTTWKHNAFFSFNSQLLRLPLTENLNRETPPARRVSCAKKIRIWWVDVIALIDS